MKRSLSALAALVALTAAPVVSHAQDNPLSFNLGAVTDYRYRGISQSRLMPALQGGLDYALPSGFYVGVWASTIRWIRDTGGDARAEWDLYGGVKGKFDKNTGYDVGVLSYVYPSNALPTNADTTEIYGALSFGPTTLKYSHSVTNLFGFPDSKNSGYLDLSANIDLGNGLTLAPHVGHQRVAHNSDYSYTDFSLTLSQEVEGAVISAALVSTDTKSISGGKAYASPANGRDLGRTGLIVAVKIAF